MACNNRRKKQFVYNRMQKFNAGLTFTSNWITIWCRLRAKKTGQGQIQRLQLFELAFIKSNPNDDDDNSFFFRHEKALR